ncbi:MAG: hypothetical protein IPI10_00670 [Bacteroidetes bacterium]|nr:hypothetical protein [Bacteroidota bacterium]
MERKIKLTLLLLTSLIQFTKIEVIAQATVANNVIATTDFLGSSNNVDVLLKAGGVQYGKLLYSSGFLGIGNLFNPISRLPECSI